MVMGLGEWREWLLAFLSCSKDGEVGAEPHSSLPGRLILELKPGSSMSRAKHTMGDAKHSMCRRAIFNKETKRQQGAFLQKCFSYIYVPFQSTSTTSPCILESAELDILYMAAPLQLLRAHMLSQTA